MSRKPDHPIRAIRRAHGPTTAPSQQPGDAVDEVGLIDHVAEAHVRALGEHRAGPSAGRTIGLRSPILVLACAPGALPTEASATLRLVTRPTSETGWRSEAVALGAGGLPISAEVVAAPAQVTDREITATGQGFPDGAAKRAIALRGLGEADRRHCAAIRMEPMRVLPAEPGTHCEEDGSIQPAGLVALCRSVEQLVPAGGPRAPDPHLRRLHVYTDVAPGTLLAVFSLMSRGAPPAPSSLSRRSFVTRLADGAIVAFSETVLR